MFNMALIGLRELLYGIKKSLALNLEHLLHNIVDGNSQKPAI